jgi:hypothetical protein
VGAGINLVTLIDDHVYTEEKINEGDLFYSLVIMSRAHDESRHKSNRLGEAWANKRTKARENGKPITKRCPAWLNKDQLDQHGRFKVHEDRANIVRSIFEDAASGIGSYSITRRLNEKNIPAFGESAGWQTSSVSKILTSRAVLGEFQPHKFILGKRKPDGEPIKDYFPPIVDEQLFYRAQQGRADRRLKGQGRKGARVSNLFSRIATCEYCNSPMGFENKGEGSKGGRYLICDRKKRGFECKSVRWKYDDFEASFLAFVQELDLHGLLQAADQTGRRSEITAEVNSLRGQLVEAEEQREKTFELYMAKFADKDYVAEKLNFFKSRIEQLNTTLKRKEDELHTDTRQLADFYNSKEQIQTSVKRLQQEDGPDIYKIRAQISTSIRNLVSGIRLAPVGRKTLPWDLKFSRPEWGPEERINYRKRMEEMVEFAKRKYFVVSFKRGGQRIVLPSEDDPLGYTDQFISKGKSLIWVDEFGGELEVTADRTFQRRPPRPSTE